MKKSLLLITVLTYVMILHAQDAPKPDSLQQYTGKYKFPDGSAVTEVSITLSDSTLTVNSALGSAPLHKTQGDEFEIVGYGGIATFKRNAEGKVSGISITVGDISIEGTKSDGLANVPVRLKLPGTPAGLFNSPYRLFLV